MRNPNTTTSSSSASGSVKAGMPTPCCSKVGLKRGPWTPEEDEILSRYVAREGEGRWRTLPKRAGLLRCGKSCRLRWMNYLRPSIKHGQIAPDEEDLILRLHRLLGNRWSLIAGRIPGRTDNEIKNYWNTHLSKKLISQGIDPRTHKPLNFEGPNPNPNPVPNHKFQIPAPPPAPHPNPNPNPNPLPSSVQETGGIGIDVPLCDDHNYFQEFNPDDMIALHGSDNSGEDAGILDCCHDDGFSSFLDSLINDDLFMQQEQLPLQQQQQDVSGRENDDNRDQLNLTTATGSGVGLFHDLQEYLDVNGK